MFILNPYDRYLHIPNNASGAPNPLIDSTNSLPYASRKVMSITRARKASPVVSVTIASVTHSSISGDNFPGQGSARNCIPFPSFPVTIPNSSVPSSQPDDVTMICIENSPTPVTSNWLLDVQRTRSHSSFSTSLIHSRFNDSSRLPIGKSGIEFGKRERRERSATGALVPSSKENGLKKILDCVQHRKVVRKERKRSKKICKYVISDTKFLAALHKSIIWRIKCLEDGVGETNVKDNVRLHDPTLNAQDKLLAQNLRNYLIERGHDPHTLLKSPSPVSTSNFFSSTDNVPLINLSVDDSASTSYTPPCFLPPTTYSYASTDQNSLATSPPGILSMSQAVASLILKRRDRSSCPRPRALPLQLTTCCRSATRVRKSPLSKMCAAGVQAY